VVIIYVCILCFCCIEDADGLTCKSILNNINKNLIVYTTADKKMLRAKYVQVKKVKRVRTVSIDIAPDNAI